MGYTMMLMRVALFFAHEQIVSQTRPQLRCAICSFSSCSLICAQRKLITAAMGRAHLGGGHDDMRCLCTTVPHAASPCRPSAVATVVISRACSHAARALSALFPCLPTGSIRSWKAVQSSLSLPTHPSHLIVHSRLAGIRSARQAQVIAAVSAAAIASHIVCTHAA
jgi:hypothetical protein